MDPIDLILGKLGAGFNEVLQYFDNREVMVIFAAVFILTSLVLINRKH
jgi:hypothetical protein